MPHVSSVVRCRRELAFRALPMLIALLLGPVSPVAHAAPAGYLHPLAPGVAGQALWDPDLHQFWVVDPGAAGVWSVTLGPVTNWTWHGFGEYVDSGSPYAVGRSVCLDRARHRLVFFGGDALYSLSTAPHAAWQRTATVGSPPSVSCGVIDEAGDRLIYAAAAGALWQLTLSDPPTWSNMGVTTPLPRFDGRTPIVFDPVHRVIVAAGGSYFEPMCPGFVPTNAVWKLPLSTLAWSAMPDLPMADMSAPPLLWDGPRHRVLAIGGYDAYACDSPVESRTTRIYALDMESASPAWTPLIDQPDYGYGCAGAIDADTDELVAFGGAARTTPTGPWLGRRGVWSVWIPAAGANVWFDRTPEAPRSASGADMAIDPTRGNLLVHGGVVSGSEFGDDGSIGAISRFHDSGLLWTTLGWAHDATGAAAIVDPQDDALILFGGCADSPAPVTPCDFAAAGTTTVVSLATGTATEPVTGTAPGARVGALMAWDSGWGRVLLFGGRNSLGDRFTDVWELNPASWTWSAIPTTGTPPEQDALSATFDAAGSRLLVLSSGSPVHVHALDLIANAWSEVALAGTVPALQSIVVDGSRPRLLGVDDHLGVHEAPLAASPLAWTPLHPPQGSAMPASAFYDAIDDRLLIGLRPAGNGSQRIALLAVDFGIGALDVPGDRAPAPIALRISGAQPSPHGPDVEFTLAPGEGPARLELFDVQGRRVWSRDVGALGAGTHRVRAGGDAWLPAGVYAVRLMRVKGAPAAARAVVLH